jgi:L-aspartate oxidase
LDPFETKVAVVPGTNVAVVGAGAAGLYTALCAAREGAGVTLISATPLAESSTYWAQGGLAAAIAPGDSPARHLAATIAAGRGAVRESAAAVLCQEAPGAVEDLSSLGVSFDADRHGRLALGLEGGHSVRRIVHAGGAATGQRLIRQLSALVAEHPGIEVLEGRRAVALLVEGGPFSRGEERGRVGAERSRGGAERGRVGAERSRVGAERSRGGAERGRGEPERCHGVLLDDGRRVASAATVLATGGAAALWARTTNPVSAVGGGLLLAYAAGAALADLELVQFHPTAVATGNGAHGSARNGADGFLVTEAIRGEGATLLDPRGRRFVDELAPRDEVARAVQDQMARSGARSVGLDMRHVDPGLFPNVVETLRRAGIDPERELVPVAPAAHYMMGGIATDLHGRATLAGLYAVGECSCTGLHGANRLASNSLTECFVFGARAGRSAAAESGRELAAAAEPGRDRAAAAEAGPDAAGADSGAAAPGAAVPDAAALRVDAPPATSPIPSPASRTALWRYAGLERDARGLTELSGDPHPLVRLIAAAALARTESRGAHGRTDLPQLDHAFDDVHVTLHEGAEPSFERWS